MVSTGNSEHKTITLLALAALAATIFVVGSGRAFAPDRDAACFAPADSAGQAQAGAEESPPLDPVQQSYNGAAGKGSRQYAQRVMAERARLEQVVRTALSRHRAAVAATSSRGG